jgi:hypothetical protein
MLLRQCSILVVNFWSVTYFGVFNFGTSYLGAKIGQSKTGKTILCKNITHNLGSHGHNHNSQKILCNPGQSDQYRILNNKVP